MAGKDLHGLIRLTRHQVDERRRALGAKLRALHDLEEQSRRLEERLVAEQDVAARRPEFAITYGAFADGVNLARERLAQSITRAELEVQVAQDNLGIAYRELKTYEESQRLRDERSRREETRREQADLDEIGQNIHRRRDNGTGADSNS